MSFFCKKRLKNRLKEKNRLKRKFELFTGTGLRNAFLGPKKQNTQNYHKIVIFIYFAKLKLVLLYLLLKEKIFLLFLPILLFFPYFAIAKVF